MDVDSSIAEATATQLEDVDTMVSGWQRMFAVTEQFAKVSGLIAGVAGCVVIGFQIARDFKTDAPVAQKALDICQVRFYHFHPHCTYKYDPPFQYTSFIVQIS